MSMSFSISILSMSFFDPWPKAGVVRDPIGYLRTKDYELKDPYALDYQTEHQARFSPIAFNQEAYEKYAEEHIREYQE